MSRFGWAFVNDIVTGSGGNPGGSDKQVQFNSGSTFSGSSNFTYDYTTNTLYLTGTLRADSLIVSSSQIFKSGSTIFGDDTGDTHQFTGSLYNTTLVSGTTARFTTITGSTITSTLITGSSLVISASVVSASTYLGIPATVTPGGANTAVQFNSGSSLSGSSNLIYDYTNNILSGGIAKFTVVTSSAYSGGTFTGTSVSGTLAQFITITGSTVTGSAAFFTNITASNISGNIAQFNTLSSSNAIVTNTTTVGNYIQLLPITNPNVPTNTTASYIYTSGSTNDMYFTQYGGGYTNTTRLRWLEGSLSTGVLHGGVLSTVTGSNTFSISSGSGIVVSYNASIGNDPYPTIKYVKWNNFVSQSLIYSSSAEITYVAIDDVGAISQTNVGFTPAQFKDRIVLGRILHQSGAVTNAAITTPTTAYAVSSNTQDFFRAFGPLKVSGHFLAASGSTLSITKTTGDSYVEGRNYTLDPNQPNYVTSANDPAITVSKIYREYVSGSTTIIDTGVGNAGYSVIDNANYNVNGIITAIGIPDKTKFQIQRVYWFPKSTTRALYVYYGNTLYSTISDAVDGITSESFTEGDNTRSSAIYVGSIIINKDCATLTDTTNSKIVQGNISRGSIGGGGGGGTTTNPGGSNHQVQFNDSGVFNGSANFTFDTSTLTVTGTTNLSGTLNLIGSANMTTITGSTVTGSTALFNIITGSAYSGGSFTGTSGRFTTFRATGATTFDAAMAVSGGISVVNSNIRVLTGSTVMALMDNFGVISGSGNLQVGGNLTVAGSTTVAHVVSQGSLSAKYQSFTGSFVVPLASWFCGINSSAGAVTASLNLANTYFAGQPITFKDIGGFAATAGKGILIQASGSDKIDGASSLVISATSGSVTVVTDGASNFFITSIV
jgi:hypothetical protein